MLQRPRAFASADVEGGQLVTSLDYEKRMVSDTSKVKMISQADRCRGTSFMRGNRKTG